MRINNLIGSFILRKYYVIVKIFLNYPNPGIHSKTLMPALQSIWFVPHLTVCIIAYALLGLSALCGLLGLYAIRKGNLKEDFVLKTDNMVYIGFSFLSLGLFCGALCAKEEWRALLDMQSQREIGISYMGSLPDLYLF